MVSCKCILKINVYDKKKMNKNSKNTFLSQLGPRRLATRAKDISFFLRPTDHCNNNKTKTGGRQHSIPFRGRSPKFGNNRYGDTILSWMIMVSCKCILKINVYDKKKMNNNSKNTFLSQLGPRRLATRAKDISFFLRPTDHVF